MFKKILCLVILPLFVHAQETSVCSGYNSDIRIPIKPSHPTGISEAQFNAILDRIEHLYAPDFAALGLKFEIVKYWTSDKVFAGATIQPDGTRLLLMHGGLARHKFTTVESYAQVVCHEIGHHLGGAPLHFYWASLEGQADYFSTLKCLRRFFQDEDNEAFLQTITVDPLAKSECEKQFVTKAEQLICIRSVMAGIASAKVSKDTSHFHKNVSIATPSTTVATTMGGPEHPELQCRLDTYFNGARCNVPWTETLSNQNPSDGTCDKDLSVVTVGSRPRCWFLPTATAF